MRILACDMNALTEEQRARHVAATRRLLEHATREELAEGYLFTVDRDRISVAELAEWVADESRCCPAAISTSSCRPSDRSRSGWTAVPT